MANSGIFSRQQSNSKVKEVCKDFLLKADEQLAYKLQDEEFHDHYDKNRKSNQNIRTNLSTVKTIENKEYQELLMRHQMLEKLEKEDALIAMQMQNEFQAKLTHNSNISSERELTDEEFAKQLQEKEIFYEDFITQKPSATTKNNKAAEKRREENFYSEEPSRIANNMSLLNVSDSNCRPFSSQAGAVLTKQSEKDDFDLAKYLQDEEEKKTRLQSEIKAQSLQLIEQADEKLARELQENEARFYENNKTYVSHTDIQSTCEKNNDQISSNNQVINENLTNQRTGKSAAQKNTFDTSEAAISKSQNRSKLPGYSDFAQMRQINSRPAMDRVINKVQKKYINKQSLV